MTHKITRCMVQCMKCALFAKCVTRDMRDVCAMCVMCAMKCMKYDIKWCKMWHKMTWNTIWNDVKCSMKWREMQIFDFGYMQRDVTLIFDRDHNLIILFLISLRIWSISVDVKLTQQDVKNLCLQIAPPYHPFCKVVKWNKWERRAKMK